MKKEKSKFTLEYIAGILNSTLMNWYYVNKFTNKFTFTVNISRTFLEQLPIKEISLLEQRKISGLVDKIQFLNKRLIE